MLVCESHSWAPFTLATLVKSPIEEEFLERLGIVDEFKFLAFLLPTLGSVEVL